MKYHFIPEEMWNLTVLLREIKNCTKLTRISIEKKTHPKQ